jgi:hypothetical protein
MSNSISAICTSNGRSISTGPGRPERIRWKACWKARGTCAGSRTVTPTWSPACDGLDVHRLEVFLVQRARGAWPVMHRMGMLSALAEYRPVIMSVPAGPEVPMHTPMLPALARV